MSNTKITIGQVLKFINELPQGDPDAELIVAAWKRRTANIRNTSLNRFVPGSAVVFTGPDGFPRGGIITKINRVTAMVNVNEGGRTVKWKVGATNLQHWDGTKAK